MYFSHPQEKTIFTVFFTITLRFFSYYFSNIYFLEDYDDDNDV